uniref:MSP domain-containing protein n=1 Tax=Chloropicon laureae TaxID=464258 RepID=A0A7S3E445_9CHLO|mmetsp:Transcript_6191/g.15970  ORF Transcript_6191/g.15970 Transcript_6191/m.15970 type:complete len:246 (+) Transcript_6191:685-1422(+)
MSKEPILIISPTELKFKFEIRKQIPATLVLHNPATHTVAFKIKTTTPKKYCVRPSTGFVLPQSKVPIQIMMSSQKEKPSDFDACRDKFLVQSVKLSEEEAEQPISANLFSKVGGKDVHECKLKVFYVSPSSPSPVKEAGPGTASNAVSSAGKALREIQGGGNGAAGDSPLASAAAGLASSAKKEERSKMGEGSNGVPLGMKKDGAPGLPLKKQLSLTGFSLLHLFVAALVAFFIGRMTATAANES